MTSYEIAKDSIRSHEGLRLNVYKDHLGNETIAYGHLLSRGISPAAADQILEDDMEIAQRDAVDVYGDTWDALSAERQAVLIEMSFQLGRKRFAGFVNMLVAARAGDYDVAAQEMIASHWATQTPTRVHELASRFKNGGA